MYVEHGFEPPDTPVMALHRGRIDLLEPLREHRDVTPVGWGEQYHPRIFAGRESLRLIEASGGRR